MNLKFFLLIILIFTSTSLSWGKSNGYFPKTSKQTGKPYFGFEPYLPMNRDYSVELGTMWEQQTLYWMGGRIGFHIGTCVFSSSQTCQQYWDLFGGVGGRDGYTNGLLLTGMRWQFINYPSVVSPYVSVYGGTMTLNDSVRTGIIPTYAIGYGWSIAAHDNLDLHFGFKFGGGDQEWSQVHVGLGIKIDRLVSYYAEKIKGVGEATVNVGGKVIKGTVDVGGKVIEGTGSAIKGTLKNVGPQGQEKPINR